MQRLLAALARTTIRLHAISAATFPPGSGFGPRRLTDWELVWTLDGSAVWSRDGERFDLAPGSLLLAHPGIHDQFTWDPRQVTRHGFVHFDLDDPPAGMIGLPPRTIRRDGVLPGLLQHLLWLEQTRPDDWELLAASALRHVLGLFATGSDGAGGNPACSHPVVERALAEAARVWGCGELRPVPVARLARAAGVTRAHLSRVFVRELGAAPAEALRQIRLDHAARLLARSGTSVAEAARSAGFTDPFHFSRAFRAAYGRSPRAFRASLATGAGIPILPAVLHRQRLERPAQPG
jgi:AraC-like DNA-binding protein